MEAYSEIQVLLLQAVAHLHCSMSCDPRYTPPIHRRIVTFSVTSPSCHARYTAISEAASTEPMTANSIKPYVWYSTGESVWAA